MSRESPYTAPSRSTPESHQRGAQKLSRVPVQLEQSKELLRKPKWIRAVPPVGKEVQRIRKLLRDNTLGTVCEEAACPNLGECFGHGIATFMIMGDICTRRCPFCDVAHGTPMPLDQDEPQRLAATVAEMGLSFVVITSVDRDDLRDGGASHYAATIRAIREQTPGCQVEILVPDFRGRQEIALQQLATEPADIFNHNLETVPRLYREVRPGGDYQQSLQLLKLHKQQHPELPTKSGLMLGLGEELTEVESVMRDLRAIGCNMLTLGQYLQPSRDHIPVRRFVHPTEFEQLRQIGEEMGFNTVASAPMVRSSYHAAAQAQGVNSD